MAIETAFLRNIVKLTKYISKIKIFQDIGFSINIQTCLKKVDFFDVTLNLQNGTYCPCKDSNIKLLYIHWSSNNLPQIIKDSPNSISEGLLKNSSNHKIFKIVKVEYEDAPKNINSIQDGRTKKALPTSFSPVTSTNAGISL